MRVVMRSLVCGAVLLLLGLAVSGPASAQGVRPREVKPAYDFTKVKMPIEIIAVKLNGRELRPGEKVEGDDDWLRGISFTLKNVSDKPLAYIGMGLQFPTPTGFVSYSLDYGVDYSRGSHRDATSPLPIQPGETLELVLTKERYPVFLRILEMGRASRSFDTASYAVELVCFEGEPDLIWERGRMKRRDPYQPARFNPVAQ